MGSPRTSLLSARISPLRQWGTETAAVLEELALSESALSRAALALGNMPLSTRAGYLIRRSQRVHTMMWLDEFGKLLTSPQYSALVVLAHMPGIDQRRLGDMASLDKSSIGDVVARLESRLWIVRERGQTDRRSYVLHLSPAAEIALGQLTPKASAVQQRLLASIAVGEREAFLKSLAAVARYEPPAPAANGTMPTHVLDMDAPGHLIRRAQQIHAAIFTKEFDRELTGPQFAVMHTLAMASDLRQREVAERSALDTATARDIVLRLIRRGWVVRRGDPSDRRSQLLSLTDAGESAVEAIMPRLAILQQRLLEPLTARQSERFLDGLRQIAYMAEVPPTA